MLRAASPATLAVPRLLRSIASCAWPERSIARAGAARMIASLLPCCWESPWQMLRCSDQMQLQAHCKMGMAARERAQASFQVLKIINVNGSRRGGLDCFLDGTNYNHIHWCPPTLAALTKKGNVITDTRLTYTVHGNEF